ncbi:T3SS effector HopA1 family protein [Streptomyces varsoviensis]|uniref:T3SS effector HopA1 family protein n=1 Tax=Streptomyces varsoviensis TaxID=67373 RepID=UPI0033CD61AA
MTLVPDILAPAMAAAAEAVTVSEDGLTAAVAEETVEADSPAKLALRLSQTLYQVVHVGRSKAESSRPRSLRDARFDGLLEAAMPHTETLTGAVVHDHTEDGLLVASLGGGLRVLLPATAPSGKLPDRLPAAVSVRLPAARPALSTGFFLTDGSAGTGVGAGPHTLRVYVHIGEADAAPAVWGAVLTVLEEQGLPYRAKVTSNPRMFPRRDGLVCYLPPKSWPVVPALAERISGMLGVREDVSPFTHRVAPGVSVSWEPQDQRPGMSVLSFGEHRSAALAQAVVRYRMHPEGTSQAAVLVETCMDAGIDPLSPARNLVSPALPSVGLM